MDSSRYELLNFLQNLSSEDTMCEKYNNYIPHKINPMVHTTSIQVKFGLTIAPMTVSGSSHLVVRG